MANLLRVKRSTIYSWTSQGNLPFLKYCGRLMFDLDDIYKWIEEKKKMPRKYD